MQVLLVKLRQPSGNWVVAKAGRGREGGGSRDPGIFLQLELM